MCFSFVQAQELDEIIAKHIEARGGAEKWAAIDNMKITGRFTAFSVEEDWMAIKTKEGKYYSELYLGKYAVIEAFDGEHGWTIDPWQEITYPRLLNATEENVFHQKSELMTPFFRYKEKGLQAEFLGKEDLDGVEVFAIQLTRPNGKFEIWYIDATSYLEYKSVSIWTDFSYPSEAESYFEDFREVDGLVIPFYVEKSFSQRNRVLMIENIDLNIPVDEELFKMAKSPEMEKIAFLVGNWEVKVEGWSGRANRWYPMGETTSEIEFDANNMIEEEISITANFVIPMTVLYSYHAKSGKYRLAMYNDFSSEMNMFLGQMNDTAFMADNLNVSYGEEMSEQAFGKVMITPVDKDHFTVEIQNSFDKGETWNAGQRLSYSRKE